MSNTMVNSFLADLHGTIRQETGALNICFLHIENPDTSDTRFHLHGWKLTSHIEGRWSWEHLPNADIDGEMELPRNWVSALKSGEVIASTSSDFPDTLRAFFGLQIDSVLLAAPVSFNLQRAGFLLLETEITNDHVRHLQKSLLQIAAKITGQWLQRSPSPSGPDTDEGDGLGISVTEEMVLRELEEVGRWKDRMVRSVSHEFLSPLSALLGFSSTLLENEELLKDEEVRNMCLTHIHEQAHRLESAVNRILHI